MMHTENFKRFLAIRASAGTGKTFVLTVRYVSILIKGGDPRKIYTITFTNKARDEMEDRISAVLENIDDPEYVDYLNSIVLETGLDKAEVIRRSKVALDIFLKSFHKITTIDSLINSILRVYSPELEITGEFKIREKNTESESVYFFEKIEKTKWFKELASFANKINKKPIDLIESFCQIYDKEVELDVPYTHVYSMDKEKLLEAKNEIKDICLSKAQALQNMIVNNPAANKTMMKMVQFEKFEDILGWTLLEKESLEYRTFSKIYTPELDEVFLDFKEQIKLYYSIEENYFIKYMLDLYNLYKEAVVERNIKHSEFDFNDIANLVYNFMNSEKFEKEKLAFKMDGKIKHLLVDEFQDTSIIQFKILSMFIPDILNDSEEDSSLFLVGDQKQSIYRFRGGNEDIFDFAIQAFHLEEETLNVNYRSSESVIQYTNNIFSQSYDNFVLQNSRENAPEGNVYIHENKDENLMEETIRLVKEKIEHGVDPKDITILAWTNKDLLTLDLAIKNSTSAKTTLQTSTNLVEKEPVQVILNLMKFYYFEKRHYYYKAYSLLGRDVTEITQAEIDGVLAQKEEVLKLFNFPSVFGYKIVEMYNLFNYDFNILKAIEIFNNFKDLEDLFYNIQFNREPVISSGEQEGILLTTIHKSKGLEWKHVIVLDRLNKEGNFASPIGFQYDGIYLQKLYVKSSSRKKVDADYAKIIEDNERLERRDKLNASYVALTRARNDLSVIFHRKYFSVFKDIIPEQK